MDLFDASPYMCYNVSVIIANESSFDIIYKHSIVPEAYGLSSEIIESKLPRGNETQVGYSHWRYNIYKFHYKDPWDLFDYLYLGRERDSAKVELFSPEGTLVACWTPDTETNFNFFKFSCWDCERFANKKEKMMSYYWRLTLTDEIIEENRH